MLYFELFIWGLLGICTASAIKIHNINQRTPVEVSINYILKQYVRVDFSSILLSFLGLFITIGAVRTYINTGSTHNPIPGVSVSYQELGIRFIGLLVCSLGFAGTSIILAFNSKVEKVIHTILNAKDNISAPPGNNQ